MNQPLRIAVAGLGRMGSLHALHVHEYARDTGNCTLVAVADHDPAKAQRVAAACGFDVPIYQSVDQLAAARVCDAVFVVTPTDQHRDNAATLIRSGHRVLIEKPLTGTLEGDREFAAELDREAPGALMLAFQRRFDPALQYAKDLLADGAIGRAFKIYSALEDSGPAPDGYRSGGILPDMSVHNVDEILWLTGAVPRAALAVGSRIYSHALTTAVEDFDDALLCMWMEDGTLAQLQVTRNHVSGYRVETIIYGEKGQIQVGRFDQKPHEVIVAVFGKRGSAEPIARRTFPMRRYDRPLPEFADRFGEAYKAEFAAFVECCNAGRPFPTTHRDGVRAQEVITAAMNRMLTVEDAETISAQVGVNHAI
jgi:myo-inositol 2-dehydrogenase/D-chiro-inositol 1-dehydrogenase